MKEYGVPGQMMVVKGTRLVSHTATKMHQIQRCERQARRRVVGRPSCDPLAQSLIPDTREFRSFGPATL